MLVPVEKYKVNTHIIGPNRFEVIKKINKGRIGSVALVRDKVNSKFYACKTGDKHNGLMKDKMKIMTKKEI